jgi:hypothetical protein
MIKNFSILLLLLVSTTAKPTTSHEVELVELNPIPLSNEERHIERAWEIYCIKRAALTNNKSKEYNDLVVGLENQEKEFAGLAYNKTEYEKIKDDLHKVFKTRYRNLANILNKDLGNDLKSTSYPSLGKKSFTERSAKDRAMREEWTEIEDMEIRQARLFCPLFDNGQVNTKVLNSDMTNEKQVYSIRFNP